MISKIMYAIRIATEIGLTVWRDVITKDRMFFSPLRAPVLYVDSSAATWSWMVTVALSFFTPARRGLTDRT